MNCLDTLKKGEYVNLWTVNHLLSGVVFAGWVFKFYLNLWPAFWVYLILAIGWEIFEVYIGEFEILGNKIMDVVTGVLGFWVVYYFMVLQNSIGNNFIILSTILFVILEVYLVVDHKKLRV